MSLLNASYLDRLMAFFARAANVSYDNTESGLAATDVQAAIDEVAGGGGGGGVWSSLPLATGYPSSAPTSAALVDVGKMADFQDTEANGWWTIPEAAWPAGAMLFARFEAGGRVIAGGVTSIMSTPGDPSIFDSEEEQNYRRVPVQGLIALRHMGSNEWVLMRLHAPSQFAVSLGDSGAVLTVDWGTGHAQATTLSDDVEFGFQSPGAPIDGLLLVLTQDSTPRTVTWPGNVLWPAGTPPTISTGSGDIDVFRFAFDGTNYYGSVVGQAVAP
jgi:hypothetical protein